MKLQIKHKAERTATYTMRLRVSLIQELKQLRAEADEAGLDFSASLQDLMEEVAKEYRKRLQKQTESVHKTYTKSTQDSYTNGGREG
jgi:hypothetical protein